MPTTTPDQMTNWIAIGSATIALGSAFISVFAMRSGSKQHRQTEARELATLIAGNYLALETASSTVFQYMAERADAIGSLRGNLTAEVRNDPQHSEGLSVLLQIYYQSLNLFEVCARFRRDKMIEPQVFASWVAWMAEILDDSYFRERWEPLIRANYTHDVRDIFDVGFQIYATRLNEKRRDQAFYDAVADIMRSDPDDPDTRCTVVAGWLAGMKETEWTSLQSSSTYRSTGRSRTTSRRRQQPSLAE